MKKIWHSILSRDSAEPDPVIIKKIQDAYNLCSDMGNLAQESFQVLSIGGSNRLINRYMVSLGSVVSSVCGPREVFRPAIYDGAVFIILLHNHPDGDPTPTDTDIAATKRLIKAGKILGIEVIDHAIIVHTGYCSMREEGLVDFEQEDE